VRSQKLADGESLNLLRVLLVQHCSTDSSVVLVAGWERHERSLVRELTPFVLIKEGIMAVVLKPCCGTWKVHFYPFAFLE